MSKNLRAALEAPDVQAWKPAVGDLLIGEVVGYSEGRGAHGMMHICEVANEATGELVGIWLGAVLLDEFKKIRPAPGERIGIRRMLDGKNRAGSLYKRFRVEIDRPGAADVPNFHDTDEEPEP